MQERYNGIAIKITQLTQGPIEPDMINKSILKITINNQRNLSFQIDNEDHSIQGIPHDPVLPARV